MGIMKNLDYEELWDSFTSGERRAVLESIWHGRQRYNHEQTYASWKELPVPIREDLADVDWEFALGRRFSARN